MKTFLISILSMWMLVQEVPYKASDEFEVKLKFEFRTKTTENSRATGPSSIKTSGPLPYLNATVKILTLTNGEARVRVENTKGELIKSKKLAPNQEINFDLGFTDDLKDRTSNHEFVVRLLNADKKTVSRIVIHFDEDGSYFVNGEKRGKV